MMRPLLRSLVCLSRRFLAGVAQQVEQLICNQPVGGSIPLASSIFAPLLFPRGDFQSLKIVARVSVFAGLLVPLMPKNSPSKPVDTGGPDLENVRPSGGVPEWPKGSDCKSDARASVVRIHPPPPRIISEGVLEPPSWCGSRGR